MVFSLDKSKVKTFLFKTSVWTKQGFEYGTVGLGFPFVVFWIVSWKNFESKEDLH